jgi:hypothetical protein
MVEKADIERPSNQNVRVEFFVGIAGLACGFLEDGQCAGT